MPRRSCGGTSNPTTRGPFRGSSGGGRVRRGDAEIASIDAVTWAYLSRDDPDAVSGLIVVDRGPLVPTLPLIVTAAASDERVAQWRRALADATNDTLLIRGFVPLDLGDYDTALGALLARIG